MSDVDRQYKSATRVYQRLRNEGLAGVIADAQQRLEGCEHLWLPSSMQGQETCGWCHKLRPDPRYAVPPKGADHE